MDTTSEKRNGNVKTTILRYLAYITILFIIYFVMDNRNYKKVGSTEMAKKSAHIDTIKPNSAYDMKAAKKLYNRNCAVCHLSKGEGLVGPNLTDEYWIHGGSQEDIEHIIKVGVSDKGMEAMESTLSDLEIKQLTNYVISMQGTQPGKGKEPEGDLYPGN